MWLVGTPLLPLSHSPSFCAECQFRQTCATAHQLAAVQFEVGLKYSAAEVLPVIQLSSPPSPQIVDNEFANRSAPLNVSLLHFDCRGGTEHILTATPDGVLERGRGRASIHIGSFPFTAGRYQVTLGPFAVRGIQAVEILVDGRITLLSAQTPTYIEVVPP